MAFELTVEYTDVPDDLSLRWAEEIRKLGALIEFLPGFAVDSWGGGFVPMKLTVPAGSQLPNAVRFGRIPLSAGCEVDFWKGSACFRTAMGRTVAEFCSQVLAAAGLAAATNGRYFDPQSGRDAHGLEAGELALEELRGFAASADSGEWDNGEFLGWEVFE